MSDDSGPRSGRRGGDPASAERAELERIAYSRDTPEAEARQALERLSTWNLDKSAALPTGPGPSSTDPQDAPVVGARTALGEGSPVVSTGATPPGRPPLVGKLLVAAAIVAVGIGAFVAGSQSAAQQAASTARTSIGTAERDSDIARALARPRRDADLPTGYQPGDAAPFAGNSYRLLHDSAPGAGSETPRWRVWVGQGIDENQLCIVSAYDPLQVLSTCYGRTQLFTGTFTITSPVGSAPLGVRLTRGAVSITTP